MISESVLFEGDCRASAPLAVVSAITRLQQPERLPYSLEAGRKPMLYGQSPQFFTNPARTGFSRMYSHFDCADSSDLNKRSKDPGCHCHDSAGGAPALQLARISCRIQRLIAAERLPTGKLRSRGAAITCKLSGITIAAYTHQLASLAIACSKASNVAPLANTRLRSFTQSVMK